MTTPTTLRDLTGLGHTPNSLKDSALVMIDCQNTYREGVMRLVGVEEALVEAKRVLDRARELGRPVIHIRHDAGVGSPYDVTAPIGQISDIVAPQGDERVITKAYPNSFVGTGLDDELKKLGVKNLVLTGFMTHVCINSTARGAFNLGYAATVVGNATATRDLPAIGGGVVPAQALHAASLAALSDIFAVVVPSFDALAT
ncbi:MAG: cysteine hydrolase [Gammaproteobacteria bacterium]|jgi:nicotinamidase-related amidase|nr:cysteine hydrolase [Gammaproteobacteria bacterium]MBU0772600.1 cysteine hydrolase [Gammaproteobacteria bacterium]MBU0855200.1 cysteine hydrolase [Gammaproteobacteria bacterium]MBU1847390.1 cysteine hydrolase [Gammaproteobacteria bacterium]